MAVAGDDLRRHRLGRKAELCGDVLLDALVVMDRLPAIPPGDTQMLEVELEEEFAYVVLSSLPGDYDAGMSAQVVPR